MKVRGFDSCTWLKLHSKHIHEIILFMNECSNCSRETRNKKYCSRSCSATVNNKGLLRNKPGGTVQARGFLQCKYCLGEVKGNAKTYCSVACQQKSQNREKIDLWLDGKWDGSSAQGASLIVKNFLLNQCRHKCSKCGWKEVNATTGKAPLEINHIDGDCTNNRPENLEILCPNCHSLTSNYRALNKNSKRKYRRVN